MNESLRQLSRAALTALAEALASGRLQPPFTECEVSTLLGEQQRSVAIALEALHQDGMQPKHIALLLRHVAQERAAAQQAKDRVQLVWSPPDLDRVDARDTAVVVQELFRTAQKSILIATYAIDKGEKAAALFGPLAARMDDGANLAVTIVANLHVEENETELPTLIKRFATHLRQSIWPGNRLPNVYIDPRSADPDRRQRYALHAKCIVADERWSLLTSANFTEAAQDRNIEAGLLLDDPPLATRLKRQFSTLIQEGALVRVPV